jgi:transcription elongation factor GreA-like protein
MKFIITESQYELLENIQSIPLYKSMSSSCKSFFDRLKKEFPNTPEYVLKEFTINVLCGDDESFRTVMNQYYGDPIPFLGKMIYDYLNGKWELTIIQVNPEDFIDNTVNAFIERNFGDINAYMVHKDEERMDIQRKIAIPTGKNEPIIVIKHKNGKYELVEGWHRTMSTLKLGDNGEDLKNWDKVKLRAFVVEM